MEKFKIVSLIIIQISFFCLCNEQVLCQFYASNEYFTCTPSISNDNELYLESFFSPDTIPQSGIPVIENALGDIIKDNIVNLLDLLRLRDIIIGRLPSPSVYEKNEGDLTQDGIINQQDLNYLRDILLHKSGVPYLIDSSGGQVFGDGITLTIPPNSLDSITIISVRRYSETEFAKKMGVDTKGAIEDSAYFMASFEISSKTIDFKLPIGTTIKLDDIPPCAYQGLNGLFAAVPDRDGDGKTELFMINELQPNGDSLTITANDIPSPIMQSLSFSEIEPGQLLIIHGNEFGDDPGSIIIRFLSIATTESVTVVPPEYIINETIIATVPGDIIGQVWVEVYSLQTNLASNQLPLTILPNSPVAGDIRAIIIGYFQGIVNSLDSASLDKWFLSVEDTVVQNYLLLECQEIRSSLYDNINYFITLPDSLLPEFEPFASFIINESEVINNLSYIKNTVSIKGPCTDAILNEYEMVEINLKKMFKSYKRLYNLFVNQCLIDKFYGKCSACEAAERWRLDVLRITDILADTYNLIGDRLCHECPGEIECDKCKKTVSVGFGPKGQVTAAFDENGFWKTSGVCTNIKKYKSNECIGVLRPVTVSGNSPVPVTKPSFLECPISRLFPVNTQSDIMSVDIPRPHPGSIIRATNVPVSYNMVGILNDNGKAFIPSVPLNTKVTFSIYDPVTGFYDPDAGTYTTGNIPGGFDRPMLLFMPNATIRKYPLLIGDVKGDSITLALQRIDYLLNIKESDTSKLFNIGFSSKSRLSLLIQDPDGVTLFNNSDVSCYANAHLRFRKVGNYLVRVAIGMSGQAGQFSLGVNYSPFLPIPSICLCGNILVDTLFSELSPYTVQCNANITTNDTVIAESGVILQFKPGGFITTAGTLIGEGNPIKPIILKKYDGPGYLRQKITSKKFEDVMETGKEVRK